MAKKQFKGPAKDFINAMKMQFIGKGADPNDIFVQDLYNYESSSNSTNFMTKLIGKNVKGFGNLSMEDRKTLETILKVYNQHVTSKRELLMQARQLFETDIVQTVIDVMIDDGFNSFNNEKEEFRIEYDLDEDDKENLGEEFQDQVQRVIDDFVDKFSLKTRIAEIIPELLRDGEYALGILFDEENRKGITEIVDDMDVMNMIPFYEGDKLSFVINQNEFEDKSSNKFDVIGNSQIDNKIQFYKPDNMVFFRLKGPTKKRINMSAFYDNEFRNNFYERTHIKLPKYVRIPLPIYYSAMKNLNRLKLMEDVSTVLDLSGVLKSEIVTVTVPSTANSQEAAQITRDYERHLNDNGMLSDTDSLDISTLAAQANRRKVLPQWMDTKGTLTKSDIGTNDSKSQDAWNTITNLRNLIALSIGIPPFYINPAADGMQNKAQVIKLYSRYTRKLTSLQKSLADGIKDLLMIHCDKIGVKICRENLVIKFKAITSGDSLDDTDMMVATVTGINDLWKGLDEITASDNNNLVIDDQQFKELFDNLTSRYLNIKDLIKIDEGKFESDEFESEEDDGFIPDERPSRSHSIDNEVSHNIDNDFEAAGVSGGGDDAYNDFVNVGQDIEIEEPQEIITEM